MTVTSLEITMRIGPFPVEQLRRIRVLRHALTDLEQEN